MMVDPHMHLKRRKDGVEVITLLPVYGNKNQGSYSRSKRHYYPVRYCESGRKGYIKVDQLENDFVVLATGVDVDARWQARVRRSGSGPSEGALQAARDRDIRKAVEQTLRTVPAPAVFGSNRSLGYLNPSPAALGALEQAIHMILAGA